MEIGNNEDFGNIVRKVIDGSMPIENLLTNETYLNRANRICCFYARTLDRAEDKDDLLQELSFKVFQNIRKLRQFDNGDRFFRWLSTVARHISIDKCRKNNRQGEREDSPVEKLVLYDTTPSPYLEQAVQEWVLSLPPLRKHIIQIYTNYSKISTRDVAKLLAEEGIRYSHVTVATELSESLKSFLEVLEKVGLHERKRLRARRTG